MSENSSDSESVRTSSSTTIDKSPVYDRDPELNELLTRKQPRFRPQAPKCAKCLKSVYAAEEVRAANKTFHKLCFKCTSCNKLLETNILTEHQGDLFCRSCYAKHYGPKGYGYGLGAGTLSSDTSLIQNSSIDSEKQTTPTLKSTFSTYTANGESISISGTTLNDGNQYASLQHYEKKQPIIMQFGGSDKCYRCLKNVYAAEKVIAAGKPFHKLCYNCFTCKKLLNSMNCCDNSEGEIFCKSCYGKLYGPKGVGHGINATAAAVMPAN